MNPNEPELNQDRLDEQACGERINYWLKKYDCTLHGVAVLENGRVAVNVGIVKIPLEVRKQLKQAEKDARKANPNPPAEGVSS